MKLLSSQIKHVAKLAKLPLTDEELEKIGGQLSDILGYIAQLETVDTKDILPTFNVTSLESITRVDEVGKSLPQEEALANAPVKKEGFFVTKGVFENE